MGRLVHPGGTAPEIPAWQYRRLIKPQGTSDWVMGFSRHPGALPLVTIRDARWEPHLVGMKYIELTGENGCDFRPQLVRLVGYSVYDGPPPEWTLPRYAGLALLAVSLEELRPGWLDRMASTTQPEASTESGKTPQASVVDAPTLATSEPSEAGLAPGHEPAVPELLRILRPGCQGV